MDNDVLSHAITKALAYTENGGKIDINHPKKGKTGETKSIFQFTPDTWKKDSRQIFGKDNIPMTADTETYVVTHKVNDWIKQGKTARQIASMWNAGESEPDAYTGKFSNGSSSVGVNKKYGVKFNVPDYADKVLKYAKQFYQEKTKQPMQDQEQAPVSSLDSLVSMIKGASASGNTSTGNTPTVATTAGTVKDSGGLMSKVLPQRT